MTWVSGAGSIGGHGILVSDVRVTFTDKSEADLLRKSYPVGPYIMAGFAGSVQIGMKLIKNLTQELESRKSNEDGAWVPESVAKHWSSTAAKVFAGSVAEERKLGSQIVLVGLTQERKPPFISQVSLITLKGPNFLPKYQRRAEMTRDVAQIGSGAELELYRDLLRDFSKEGFSMTSSNSLQKDMLLWSEIFSDFTRRKLAKEKIPGISPHLHLLFSRIGEFGLTNNDNRFDDGLTFKMPDVASDYETFLKLCKAKGKAAAGAIA